MPIAATWRREDERGVAQRLAARDLQLARAQHDRVAAELEDAGLERQPRARRRLLEDERDRPALERPRAAAARPSSARRGRPARAARRAPARSPVRKCLGKAGILRRDAHPHLEPLPRAVAAAGGPRPVRGLRGARSRRGSGTSRCCRRSRRGGRGRWPSAPARRCAWASPAATSLPAPAPARRPLARPHEELGRREQRDPRPRRAGRPSTAASSLRWLPERRLDARGAARGRHVDRQPPRPDASRARGPSATSPRRRRRSRAGAPEPRAWSLGGDFNIPDPYVDWLAASAAGTASTTSSCAVPGVEAREAGGGAAERPPAAADQPPRLMRRDELGEREPRPRRSRPGRCRPPRGRRRRTRASARRRRRARCGRGSTCPPRRRCSAA